LCVGTARLRAALARADKNETLHAFTSLREPLAASVCPGAAFGIGIEGLICSFAGLEVAACLSVGEHPFELYFSI